MVKQVRAEQSLMGLLKEKARVPTVRKMRGMTEAEAVLARNEFLVLRHPPGRSDRKIIHVYDGPHEAANGLGGRGDFQPLIQSPAFVRLKMAEADPAYFRRINELSHCLAHNREHGLIACM